MFETHPRGLAHSWRGRFILACGLMAFVAALGVLISPLGVRFGWWGPFSGLSSFRMFAQGALFGVGLATAALVVGLAVRPRLGLVFSIVALAAAALAAYPALKMRADVERLPRIHDITTDMETPPEFLAARAIRTEDQNSLDYAGEAIAAQQRQAYPDIQPILLAVSPDEAFAIAQRAVEQFGWTLLEANRAEGRIEAVAASFWFGFKDDVVIRITDSSEGGARIDIRSASRIGRSDIGANAKRIRRFADKVRSSV